MRLAVLHLLAALVAGASLLSKAASAQTAPVTLAQRSDYVPLETVRAGRAKLPSALARPVTVRADSALLQQVLLDIANQAGLGLSYGEAVVRSRTRVAMYVAGVRAADALAIAVERTRWAVLVTPSGQVTVVPAEPAQTGTIVGTVTDRRTGAPVAGAVVDIPGTGHTGSTAEDGSYRIAEVPATTHTVRARYIGYTPLSVAVAVRADSESRADFALERSAQKLDELVTTGTVLPTETRAIPSPITVVTADDIDEQRPRNVQQLLRQAVPSAVSWDAPPNPNQTILSVRGASTLELGSGSMKVFVDGLEVASVTAASVDPSSVERVEVIRGPQAATIYGSDAISGVIQIFTKRGGGGLQRPALSADAELGMLQTPYPGFGSVLRQDYTGSVRGGDADMSYNLGAGYSRTGNYLPDDQESAQSRRSVYGGMRFSRGITTVDLSGRHLAHSVPNVFNPTLIRSGFTYWSKPFFQAARHQSQSVGARISLAPARWWNASVNVGLDRLAADAPQTRPRLTTPADTLLSLFGSNQTKTTIGANTSIQEMLGRDLSGSLTLGFDHYTLPAETYLASGALNLTGNIRNDPNFPPLIIRSRTTNTGYFAQTQVGLRDALFLTAGLRAESNTNFGDAFGTPVSPRVGVSYVGSLSAVTLKLRGSYGAAIRPPRPHQRFASPPSFVTNPNLGPERQKGWDAGVDAIFGNRASISVSYFSQTADDLIQDVLVQGDPTLVFQYQNIGRVKNQGVEVEGTVALGSLQLQGQYAYVRARVDRLSPTYSGELLIGDQAGGVPRHTAGASVTYNPFRTTTLIGGLTYVGNWRSFDLLSYFGCLGGTVPCRNDTFALDRSYVAEYEGFAKLNVRLLQQLTPHLGAFVAIDNLTNNDAQEFLNNLPVVGRTSTLGIRVGY